MKYLQVLSFDTNNFLIHLLDVKGILGDQAGIFDDPAVTENAYRTYNTDQMIAVDAGDHKVGPR